MTNENVFKEYKFYWGNDRRELTFGYTKRHNGQSTYPKNSFNMALYIGDEIDNVHAHQLALAEEIDFPVSSWMLPIQKHGGNVLEVSKLDRGTNVKSLGQGMDNIDAVYTYDKGILLTMNYADCIPVYVYSVSDNFTGLAHAGWRGTAERITAELINSYRGSKNDLRVIIGVGINQAYYEVDDAVINALKPLTGSAYQATDSGWLLDLKEVNKHQAIEAGINEANISVTGLCTEMDDFFSFRLEKGNTGRALAFIGRREE